MSLRYHDEERTPTDDGLNLQNCGYAIVLVASYVVLALMIGGAIIK